MKIMTKDGQLLQHFASVPKKYERTCTDKGLEIFIFQEDVIKIVSKE